jgi:hypothetical protein
LPPLFAIYRQITNESRSLLYQFLFNILGLKKTFFTRFISFTLRTLQSIFVTYQIGRALSAMLILSILSVVFVKEILFGIGEKRMSSRMAPMLFKSYKELYTLMLYFSVP